VPRAAVRSAEHQGAEAVAAAHPGRGQYDERGVQPVLGVLEERADSGAPWGRRDVRSPAALGGSAKRVMSHSRAVTEPGLAG
jgi:hypothetical protein